MHTWWQCGELFTAEAVCEFMCSSSEEENVMGLLICLQLDVRPSKPRAGCSVPATFLTNVEIC